MGKNDLARRVKEAYNAGFLEGMNKGIETGIQYNNDIYQCILNDPAVMGKDTFGKDRMLKVHQAAEAASEYYSPALRASENESDVYRSKLDAKLKKIWGDMLMPFEKRMPELTECSYGKKK